MGKKEEDKSDRRKFLKLGALAGGTVLLGAAIGKAVSLDSVTETGEKVKVLTTDGKVVEVDSSAIKGPSATTVPRLPVREGLPGKKLVRVIDLGRCANARKCIEGCQKAHKLLPPIEYIKVKKMQDADLTSPYWFPTMCYHCDNPPCTKVCPVDATFKRSDGIVGIDSDRCIGCKFCMAACPYGARTFNFGRPQQVKFIEEHKDEIPENYCATQYGPEGTVSKCDFCPDRAAEGLLPACVLSCPNGAIFQGDEIEDVVTNGEDTFRLSKLLKDRAGYRQFEELGTKPRVYYLGAVKRLFPFEEATEAHNTEE